MFQRDTNNNKNAPPMSLPDSIGQSRMDYPVKPDNDKGGFLGENNYSYLSSEIFAIRRMA